MNPALQILLLKLFLAPVIIVICTLIARRYGHTVGGIIVGLPLTSGPIAFILAMENGKAFAAQATNGILLGLVAVEVFLLCYAFMAKKVSWPACTLLGLGAFFTTVFLLRFIVLPVPFVFAIALASMLAALRLFPASEDEYIEVHPPKHEILLRAMLTVAFICLLTYSSDILGPHLSGLLSPFPLYGSIFAASTHQFYGANATIRLLRGIVTGSFSFAVFFLALSLTLVPWGIGFSFLFSTVAALFLQYFFYKSPLLKKGL